MSLKVNLFMQKLTSKDQLLQEAERGHIFNGYCEGTLTFKPTYKYNIGSSNYDTSYKVSAFLCLRMTQFLKLNNHNLYNMHESLISGLRTCVQYIFLRQIALSSLNMVHF